MEFDELQQKFHAMMGAYLSSRIFSEYAIVSRSFIDLKTKGQPTLHNRMLEAENRANMVTDLLAVELRKIGCDLKFAEDHVDELETTIHAHLQLNEVNQKRVMGLIHKLQKEQKELS